MVESKGQGDGIIITAEMVEAGLLAFEEWEEETGLNKDMDYITLSHADDLVKKICRSTLSCLKDSHIPEIIPQAKKSL